MPCAIWSAPPKTLARPMKWTFIDRLVPVAGLDVVDVGCGSGRITRQLAERGARALGVEPDPIQAEKNRTADAVSGLSFVEAPGQALPVDDGSMDGVFFSYSLHHVPGEHMDGALTEAVRVLKPETGFLYVLEPMLAGSLEAVHRPFHDETEVRTLAYDALRRTAAPHFAEAHEFRYRESVRHDSFATLSTRWPGPPIVIFPASWSIPPRSRRCSRLGRADYGYVFTQHIRVNLYRRPLA